MPSVSGSWLEIRLLGLAIGFSTACAEPEHRLGGVTCGAGAERVMIDDMEDSNKAAIIQASGRAGTWYAYNDNSAGSTQRPGSLVDVFPMERLEPARGASQWAARTRGGGFSNWGAGIAFDLNLKDSYDASEYTGISFFVHSRLPNGYPVRVQISDRFTSPRGGECRGGDCNDDFGANVVASPEWQEIRLHWSELLQLGFGRSPLPTVDTSAVYAIKFQVGTYTDFDFFIDDVAFLCTDPALPQ